MDRGKRLQRHMEKLAATVVEIGREEQSVGRLGARRGRKFTHLRRLGRQQNYYERKIAEMKGDVSDGK